MSGLVNRGSVRHDFLLVTVSQTRAKGYVTYEELGDILGSLRGKLKKTQETASYLRVRGLIENFGEGVRITPAGVEALVDVTRRTRRDPETNRVTHFNI